MRVIGIMLRKEFLQIFRNRAMLPIIFVMPIIQLVILVNAATFEIKHIRMDIIDHDHSSTAARLISKFGASDHFDIYSYSANDQAGKDDLAAGKADIVFIIPYHFDKDLVKENHAKVQMLVNAIDGSAAAVGSGYASQIVQDFDQGVRSELLNPVPIIPGPGTIDTRYSYWFNPELDYKTFMVPGLLVILITIVSLFLAGMNIVREKEIGTIEQINVTPISKIQFITGKLLPFWILGLFELGFGLLLGKLLFNTPIIGNVFIVFAFAGIYMLTILGMGLLISTFTDTQQQAMFLAWFFMVIFILMSGLFTPIENMPVWAQKITLINPVAYFIKVIRMVLLKGSGFAETSRFFLIMAGMALVSITLSVLNYRKTT
jgi:ABC-2 type transport system permease protein